MWANQSPGYICQTHNLKLHLHPPKKLTGHGIASIYLKMHSACYSEKCCKCSRQNFRMRDESVTKSDNSIKFKHRQVSDAAFGIESGNRRNAALLHLNLRLRFARLNLTPVLMMPLVYVYVASSVPSYAS